MTALVETLTPALLRRFREEVVGSDPGQCYVVAPALADRYGLEVASGFYLEGDQAGDHCWTVGPDGTIYDPTANQFGAPLITGQRSPRHKQYLSWAEHHPASEDPSDCLFVKHNDIAFPDERCELCGSRPVKRRRRGR